MAETDLPMIEALEDQIFPDPWPVAAFEEHLEEDDAGGLIAEIGSRMVGFACYRFDCGEAHLTNLAVDPAHRRKSVARELLGHILGLALERECELIFLEVRTSNEIARQFYEAEGFAIVERCLAYYGDPEEDAIVMKRWVGPSGDDQ